MIKVSWLFFACMAIAFCGFSQTKSNSTLAISIGPAFPVGKFASKDFSDELAGVAKPGGAVSLSFSKLFSKHLGIAAGIQAQHNPINTAAFENEFAKSYTGYPSWNFDKRSWLHAAFLLGGTAQFPVVNSKKYILVTKVMAGIAVAKSPGMSGNSISETASANAEQNKKSATGFMYAVAAGCNYAISKSLFLTASLNYNGTNKMTYKAVKTTITTAQGVPGSADYQIQQSVTTVDGKQSISSVNLLFGFGLKF